MVIKANFKTLVSLLFVVGVGLENNNNNINKRKSIDTKNLTPTDVANY